MVDECSSAEKSAACKAASRLTSFNQISENMAQDSSVGKGSSVCNGCGQEIYDQYILRVAPDLEWHAGCLKCFDCCQYLDENCTCFVRDGKPYCKRDYVRLFAAKCGKCGKTFEKKDYVMRAKNNLYHTDCFKCTICMSPLLPGDQFALRNSTLYCKADYELAERNGLRINAEELLEPYTDSQSVEIHQGALQAAAAAAKRQVRESLILADVAQNFLNVNQSTSSKVGAGGTATVGANLRSIGGPVAGAGRTQGGAAEATTSSSVNNHPMTSSPQPSTSQRREKRDKPKTTRVRTVLNEKQLHTLRTCYAANPRPDALMKEQLVEMTGLSPRVIRVWFQNKRCKDKKKQLIMKQIQQQHVKNQTLNGIRMQGVGPMIANSPSTHDVPMISAIEIQQYHQTPAWMRSASAIHDYSTSLSGDDVPSTTGQESQTPFQQLINEFGDSSLSSMNYITTTSTFSSAAMDAELDTISPQLVSSDLSSPSCSD
uniref:Homeobox domain-containing protein n=1 Tax=Trichuris muris TaxID=70415 RepID=A0A5S6QAE7_TRIMR